MDVTAIAEGRFDAMHQVADYGPCADPHGHHWTVRVGIVGELDPKTGWPRGTTSFQSRVITWCEELDRGDLAELLPGVVTSPLGIAGAVLQAMAQYYPKVSEAEVICSDGTRGVVRRSPRQL